MPSLWLFLVAAVGPLAIKILAALGVGVISYAGYGLIMVQITNAMSAQMSSIPDTVLPVLNMIGFTDSVGILLGAVSARIALSMFKRFGVLNS